MTKEILLDQLKILEENNIGIELYFVFKDKDIKKVEITNELSISLKNQFITKITDTFNESKYFTLDRIENLSSDKLESEYFYFDNNHLFENLQFILDFTRDRDCDPFKLTKTKYSNIDGLLIAIGTEENHIILYKHHYPINVLKKDSTLNIIQSGDTFKEVSDDIFKIDINFDLLLLDQHMVVNRMQTLEFKLGYNESIYSIALQNIEMIEALDFIKNIDLLQEAISDNRVAKKINKVKDSPVLKIIQNKQNKVIKFIKSHPELKMLKIDSANKLELDSKISIERFLKLLDDDYLHSKLTKMLYDSKNKKSV